MCDWLFQLELIGRCLFRCTHGFDFAYPKRAPKLLVGQSQTLLMYFFIWWFLFCIPLVLSLDNNSEKIKTFFGQFLPFLVFHRLCGKLFLDILPQSLHIIRTDPENLVSISVRFSLLDFL